MSVSERELARRRARRNVRQQQQRLNRNRVIQEQRQSQNIEQSQQRARQQAIQKARERGLDVEPSDIEVQIDQESGAVSAQLTDEAVRDVAAEEARTEVQTEVAIEQKKREFRRETGASIVSTATVRDPETGSVDVEFVPGSDDIQSREITLSPSDITSISGPAATTVVGNEQGQIENVDVDLVDPPETIDEIGGGQINVPGFGEFDVPSVSAPENIEDTLERIAQQKRQQIDEPAIDVIRRDTPEPISTYIAGTKSGPLEDAGLADIVGDITNPAGVIKSVAIDAPETASLVFDPKVQRELGNIATGAAASAPGSKELATAFTDQSPEDIQERQRELQERAASTDIARTATEAGEAFVEAGKENPAAVAGLAGGLLLTLPAEAAAIGTATNVAGQAVRGTRVVQGARKLKPFTRAAKTGEAFREEIPIERLTRPSVLEGRETFPQFTERAVSGGSRVEEVADRFTPSTDPVEEFRRASKALPEEIQGDKGVTALQATTGSFATPDITERLRGAASRVDLKGSPRPNEPSGSFVAPELSPNFLRLEARTRPRLKDMRIGLLPSFGGKQPRVLAVKNLEVDQVPSERTTPDEVTEFLDEQRGGSTAYVRSDPTPEFEALLPQETRLIRREPDFFTEIKEKTVPIDTFEEVSLRKAEEVTGATGREAFDELEDEFDLDLVRRSDITPRDPSAPVLPALTTSPTSITRSTPRSDPVDLDSIFDSDEVFEFDSSFTRRQTEFDSSIVSRFGRSTPSSQFFDSTVSSPTSSRTPSSPTGSSPFDSSTTRSPSRFTPPSIPTTSTPPTITTDTPTLPPTYNTPDLDIGEKPRTPRVTGDPFEFQIVNPTQSVAQLAGIQSIADIEEDIGRKELLTGSESPEIRVEPSDDSLLEAFE